MGRLNLYFMAHFFCMRRVRTWELAAYVVVRCTIKTRKNFDKNVSLLNTWLRVTKTFRSIFNVTTAYLQYVFNRLNFFRMIFATYLQAPTVQ